MDPHIPVELEVGYGAWLSEGCAVGPGLKLVELNPENGSVLSKVLDGFGGPVLELENPVEIEPLGKMELLPFVNG